MRRCHKGRGGLFNNFKEQLDNSGEAGAVRGGDVLAGATGEAAGGGAVAEVEDMGVEREGAHGGGPLPGCLEDALGHSDGGAPMSGGGEGGPDSPATSLFSLATLPRSSPGEPGADGREARSAFACTMRRATSDAAPPRLCHTPSARLPTLQAFAAGGATSGRATEPVVKRRRMEGAPAAGADARAPASRGAAGASSAQQRACAALPDPLLPVRAPSCFGFAMTWVYQGLGWPHRTQRARAGRASLRARPAHAIWGRAAPPRRPRRLPAGRRAFGCCLAS